jgi:hypothetical protein
MLALTAEPFLTSGIAPRYAQLAGEEEEKSWSRTQPKEIEGEPTRFRSALGSAGECCTSRASSDLLLRTGYAWRR